VISEFTKSQPRRQRAAANLLHKYMHAQSQAISFFMLFGGWTDLKCSILVLLWKRETTAGW